MLSRVLDNETDKLQEILNLEPTINARISALIKSYGIGRHFFNVWRHDWEIILARFETSFFISSDINADLEEIAFFLKFNPYFRRLTGKSEVILKIKEFMGNCQSLDFDFMTCNEQIYVNEDYNIETCPNLKSVYEVMEAAQSDDFTVGKFAPWYADVSHRIRHGCARAYLMRVNDEPVSACLVSAESSRAGLISGVATNPDFRKKGYASAVVKKACRDLLNCGKLPVLECLPALTGYYSRLGFKKTGDVTSLEADTNEI